MGKALKTAGAIIGGAVLIATGVGALAGLNVAAMGIASFTGSLTIGQLGMISAGMSAVGGMLDKPKSSGAAPATDWTSNADQPTPFAFGRVGVAGKIVHWDEYGKDNKLKSFVSVYSGAGPIKGFVSFKAGDLPVTFASNGGTAIGKYNRQMWRSWKVGNQPDTALPLPTGLDEAAVMPQWGASYKLSGKACDLWTLQQDSKLSVYPGNAEPKPLTVLEGVYGYDHRYDSTYPGGFGDCRLDDRSTWRWIENPIIAALNWALGMKENGQVVGGVGALASGIDLPAFAEAANIAEANDWKVSAWPDTSQDASVVLDQLLQAGGALRARHAGKISCVSRGAARPSIVTITRRDTAGPIELDTGASRFNRINTITPVFMSEARGWKLWPADPVTFAAFRTEDGGRTGDKIDYPFVPELQQAAQLAAYDILDAREPFSGTIPLKPHMRRLKRGDCFDIDEPGFLLDGVKCMVLGRSYDSSKGEVRIAFRSETDGKHDLALGKTTVLPEYPTLTPADPTLVSPPLPSDWTIVVRPPASGTQLPGFDLTGIVSNATATAIIVEHGPTAEGPWTTAYQGPPTVTTIPIDGLQSGETYFIAIQYQRNQNYSERAVYGPYTAPDLIAGGLTLEAEQKLLDEATKEVADKVKEATDALEAALDLDGLFGGQDDLAEAILKLGRGLLDTQSLIERLGRIDGLPAGVVVKQEVTTLEEADRVEAEARTVMSAVLGDSISAAEQSISVVASNLGVEANARLLLAGRVGTAEGAIVTEQGLRISGDQVEALARQALALVVGNNRVSAETSISAVASDLAGEVTARQNLGVRVANAEGAISAESSVRANQDGIWLQNFNLMGGRRGDSSGFILNKETLDITGEGTLASVLSGLRATDGSNSSAITNLQITTGNQASQLTTMSSTVGGHTSSISSLFSVTNGLSSRWTLALDVNNVATSLIADGVSRSLIFGGSRFAVIDDGNGLSYEPATGRMKIVRGSKKTVLGAGGGLILWAGDTTIGDGGETVDNGDLGIGSGDAWFGGRTISGPFDSGPAGGEFDLLVNNTVAIVPSKSMQATGFSSGQVMFEIFVSGSPADPEAPDHSYSYAVIAANQDGSGEVALHSGFGYGTPNAWLPINAYWTLSEVNTTRANKKIFLRIGSFGTDVRVPRARFARIRGLYGA